MKWIRPNHLKFTSILMNFKSKDHLNFILPIFYFHGRNIWMRTLALWTAMKLISFLPYCMLANLLIFSASTGMSCFILSFKRCMIPCGPPLKLKQSYIHDPNCQKEGLLQYNPQILVIKQWLTWWWDYQSLVLILYQLLLENQSIDAAQRISSSDYW